ncbi:hypothetical protein BT96DRAFT_915094 [Gymnopus androsaceus JB14]|uniref:Uncharacterized protein n=1 Tax=Gymnopus androsaceus JB14 TaxID=1447944 RepID=A0A6A4I8K9_9AGAR|nr:hypothetical protein BT96DRAFT_915094 [Gymnopus androsaceus JB14]
MRRNIFLRALLLNGWQFYFFPFLQMKAVIICAACLHQDDKGNWINSSTICI